MLGLSAASASAQATERFEAESLARQAQISGGGELLAFDSPDTNSMPFSGGRALSFVPQGKGAALTLSVPVTNDAVYQVRMRGVAGPSCGYYEVLHGDRSVASLNMTRERTAHTDRTSDMSNGVWTKRVKPESGTLRLQFVYRGTSGRGGVLVLDSLDLMPWRPPAQPPAEDPYDTSLPADEIRGENLIKNGDFEAPAPPQIEGQNLPPQGWTLNSSAPRRVPLLSADPVHAHAGRGALLLAPDPLEDNVVVYQPFKAQSGKRYRLAFHARGAGLLRVDFYQYGISSPRTDDSVRAANQFKAGEPWRLYTFVVSPSASARIYQMALALSALDGGSVFFDDVSVSEVKTPHAAAP